MHPEVFFSPVPAPAVPREGRQKTHTGKGRLTLIVASALQPAHAALSRKPTADFPPTIYLSTEKLLFLTAVFSSCLSPCVGPEERRGGEESGPLQDVG